MKNKHIINTIILLLSTFSSTTLFAQIPIVYYDFENNASRSVFQNVVEMSVNTPPAGSVFTYVASTGVCNTIGCSNAQGVLGAGIVHGGTLEGGVLTVGAWQQIATDPGTGAISYYQFSVNTAGFNGISLTFDTKFGNNNAPTAVGVLISNDGATWTLVGSTGTPNGNTIPANIGNNTWSTVTGNFNLTAAASFANNNANLYIRVYTYGATAGGAGAYLSLDNVTILATSTVAGKVFTTLDENNYYTGYTSGLTGTTLGRNSFTATGASTNVTINNTSGLKMNAGQTFSVATSATVTFGVTGSISGASGIFNIASGCSLITSNASGVGNPGSITTTGANVYTAGANYTFNAATAAPFPTGAFGNPANVTINPGVGSSVTLNISPTITGVLSFNTGKLAIGNNTLTLNGTVSGMSATNLLAGSATSNLNIGGTGALGTLFFDQVTDGTTNNIGTLTLNRALSGTLTLGNKLVSGTACNLTAGQVILSGQTLALNGTFTGSGTNNLTGSATSAVTIGGSGALGTLFFDQTTPGTTNAVSAFTLNRASSGTATLGNAVSIGGGGLNLTNGTLADGGNIITLAGSITGSGAHGGAGKISMTASGSTISSASLGNLELNNAGGFSLTGSPSVGGTLTLLSGKLILGANNLILGLASAIAGTPSSSSMIVANSTGKVRKLFSANGSFLYPIGDNTNYTPITLNFTGGAYAVGAYTEVNVKTVKHPNNANITAYLNRYWSVATSGITGPLYAVTAATYVTGDVTGTEANIATGQYTGSLPWVKFGVTNTVTHTLSSATVSNISCDFTGIATALPSVSSSSNTSICAGGSAIISAVGGTGDPTLTYTWAPSTGLSSTIGSSVTASPASTTTYTLTITDGNGFTASANTTITVSSLPSITGNLTVCIGVTNVLSNATTGGTWESSDITKASIGTSSGGLTGIAAGTTTITYTTSPGCVTTAVATVAPLPAPITGNLSVCAGTTTALGHAVSGGAWASSASGTASVNSSGVVSGLLAGTATITYTLPSGCVITAEVTVQPTPAAITGTAGVCVGLTTPLSHPVSGGTWASSASGIATVNSSGSVFGAAQGTANITYTVPAGCIVTREVTVNALPAAITGTTTVCEQAFTPLGNTTPGGTWSSGAITIATVDAGGVVNGQLAGTAQIFYTLSTGCNAVTTVTVNALPAVITGTMQVCDESSTMLSTTSTGGTWSSTVPAVGTIDATGTVAGISPGVTTISYLLPNGCARYQSVTVNPLPAAITGDLDICEGVSTPLASASGGGGWLCSCVGPTAISVAGVFYGATAGTTEVTYMLPTGCISTGVVTVDPLPATITGLNEVCINGTTTLFNLTSGGTWSSAATGTATVNPTTGVVGGIATGITTITYAMPTGCYTTIALSVNPLPSAITGTPQVCVGSTTILANSDIGGVWSSSNTSVATVDGSGNVNGIAVGISNITYMLSTGCIATKEVTVNALPSAIAGASTVCVSSAVMLTNPDASGTWGSSDAGIADINNSGVVTGMAAGVATITYTMPSTCSATRDITVNALPAPIGGLATVCENSSLILFDTDLGGTWSSSNPLAGTISSVGVVTGINAGTTTITYALPTTCIITTEVTINALPAPITGPTQICDGSVGLFTSSLGVSWSSSNPAIATINSGGVVTGVSAGVVGIGCTFTLSGCVRTTILSVKPLPAAITGQTTICQGGFSLLSNTTSGGTWGSSNAGVATINAGGLMFGAAAGNTTITYTSVDGCISTTSVIVNILPAAITGTAAVCQNLTTVLTSATMGGVWSSSATAIGTIDAVGTVTGITAGNTTITYMLGTGCYITRTATVNPLPSSITGNPVVCQGLSTTLASTPLGGTWISSNATIANVNVFTGVVAGVSVGNADITYTLPTGCIGTRTVVVNPLPSPITGTAVACVGQTSILANIDLGGTWTSGNTSAANIDAFGTVTAMGAGTATITYTLPTSCRITRVFTANPLPAVIAGSAQVCQGLSTTLTNTMLGGTWISSDAGVADVTLLLGVVSGITPGTAEITYTMPTGCIRTKSMTVNAAVSAIVGTGTVCAGLMLALSNPDAGGVWLSSNTSVATVSLLPGVVTGVNAGTVKITYTLPTSCLTTTIVTVNALPALIGGIAQVCAGMTTTLSNATLGGTWNGGATGIASIDGVGVVSTTAAGIAPVTYTLPTGCIRSRDITVNPLPVPQTITGGGSYCAGGTGVHVGLGLSASATTYKLYRGATLVSTKPGTGLVIDFGSYTVAGTYTVQATTNGTGCANNMLGSALITITPLITPSVSMSSSLGDTVCNGNSSTFTATPVNGGLSPTYQWLVNSIPFGTGSTFNYTPFNGDSVAVKLTSSEACPSPAIVFAKKRMTVIANEMPTIGVTKTTSDSICMYSPASFYAIATWAGDAPIYTWRKNGVDAATGINYSYLPNDGDIISCRLTSNFRCRLADNVTSDNIPLNVDSVYIPTVSLSAEPGLTIAPYKTATLTATVTGAGTAPVYIWKVNGATISGANTPKLVRQFEDNDVVTCLVWGTGICGLPSFNMVTMNVDIAAGISQPGTANSTLKVIPNPNNGAFILACSINGNGQEVALEITNMLGQVVYTNKIIPNNGSINERILLDNSLSAGMYILNIRSSAESKTSHFIINK